MAVVRDWYTWLLLFHCFTRFNHQVPSLHLRCQDGGTILHAPQLLGITPLTRWQFFRCDFPKVQSKKERVSSGTGAWSPRGPPPCYSHWEQAAKAALPCATTEMRPKSCSCLCLLPAVRPWGSLAGTPVLPPRTPQGGYFAKVNSKHTKTPWKCFWQGWCNSFWLNWLVADDTRLSPANASTA